jgi:hypothetical protein
MSPFSLSEGGGMSTAEGAYDIVLVGPEIEGDGRLNKLELGGSD